MLPQLVAADLLADDAFLTAHLAELRRRHRRKAAALSEATRDFVDAAPATGGMFLWGRVAVRTRPLLAGALRAGVAFVPGDAFGVDTDHAQWLRLSFATLPVAELRTAAARLRRAVGVAAGAELPVP